MLTELNVFAYCVLLYPYKASDEEKSRVNKKIFFDDSIKKKADLIDQLSYVIKRG
jgi:hypothetical protein